MYTLLMLVVACSKPDDKTPDSTDDSAVPEDDTGDSTVEDDPTQPTEGPDLPACTAQSGSGSLVSLAGVVLTPDGPVGGVVVFDTSTGLITCAGAGCDDSAATRICTEGIISPGLVDGHNHMQYNSLPPWRVDPVYDDRYDWRSDDAYYDYRTAYDAIYDDYDCEISRWAELRNLAWGATAAVGSLGSSCVRGLLRNLDEDSGASGISGYELVYSARTVTQLDESDGSSYAGSLASGSLDCVLDHVAEGVGGSVRAEADHMLDIGMAGEGFAWVHGTDATVEHLAQMASNQMGLLWSPRSNLALYAGTTQATVAIRLGLPVALGPDWSPSGSLSPLHEAQCADEYLRAIGQPLRDSDLFDRITTVPAAILGLEGQLGVLAEGAYADIAVFQFSKTPYRAVIDAKAQDVLLTLVGGEAVYGAEALALPLASGDASCESFDACGEPKVICAASGDSPSGSGGYTALFDALTAALADVRMPQGLEYAGELFPLVVCDDDVEYQRDACDPTGSPTASDSDGDGIEDTEDLCVGTFDPDQGDHDEDGVGDTCDACPLYPGTTGCRHAPEDIDDDGLPVGTDLCPVHHDPTNGDADGDGLGDACDPCPDTSNASGEGCPVGVEALADESHPDHPPEGTAVSVCDLVVTGTRANNGFFAQDPSLDEHAAIWVYVDGSFSVVEGDEVCVSGTYVEYYGLAEIGDPTITKVSSGNTVAALELDPCTAGEDSAVSEALEGMLVTVTESDGVLVTDENPDAPSDYGTFEVEGCLYVDDTLSQDYESHPAVGTVFTSITGPLTWSYDRRRVLPRSAEDLVEAP